MLSPLQHTLIPVQHTVGVSSSLRYPISEGFARSYELPQPQILLTLLLPVSSRSGGWLHNPICCRRLKKNSAWRSLLTAVQSALTPTWLSFWGSISLSFAIKASCTLISSFSSMLSRALCKPVQNFDLLLGVRRRLVWWLVYY